MCLFVCNRCKCGYPVPKNIKPCPCSGTWSNELCPLCASIYSSTLPPKPKTTLEQRLAENKWISEFFEGERHVKITTLVNSGGLTVDRKMEILRDLEKEGFVKIHFVQSFKKDETVLVLTKVQENGQQ